MHDNTRSKTVKRRCSPEIEVYVTGYARNSHVSATAIALETQREFEDSPSTRTVQEMVGEVRSQSQSRPWRLRDADADDAAVILGVLADQMYTSGGKITEISQVDAEWIIRLSYAGVGDLPPGFLYSLAITYQLREETDAATSDLDALIAFAPWRNETAWTRYIEAVEPTGLIPA